MASIIAIAWWTLLSSLVTRWVSLRNFFGIVFFSTVSACPGRAVFDALVGCFRQDVLLLGWVFAARGAAAFACVFFLALVLCAGASTFTGIATQRLNRICYCALIAG